MQKSPEKLINTLVKLPESLARRAREYANLHMGKNLSELIRKALVEYLEKFNKQ